MIRRAEAQWNGSLKDGAGHVKTKTGALDSAYSFRSRFEGGGETNPEELIAAAHAACFSMAVFHEKDGRVNIFLSRPVHTWSSSTNGRRHSLSSVCAFRF
jgi:hypothetical protein